MELPKPKTHNFFSWFLPGLFTTRQDQKLFLEYTKSQKQRAIPRLIATGMILQLFAILVPGEIDFVFAYCLTFIASTTNMMLLVWYYCLPLHRTLLSHVAWFVIWAQLLVSALRRQGDTFNELLGWAALIQYLTLATLPFSPLTLLLYSHLSAFAYIFIQYLNAALFKTSLPPDLLNQEICNASMLVCATCTGAVAYVIFENQHRRSFVETKRSLRDKLTIDQQSKEQERLLLSVLPEHVAVQMRQDIGLIDTQFKKIYMSRHENVSILYADIVGFTAISSTYSAQDLVAILNELFARFDRLAEKYQQLRIKILGDCYYCISGAPIERSDHAVLCVHMGLSMVKAIKYVQQTTNSPVDMRVGIHTGAVLAGVLGQRQWQFDVYSRDVELANKMESSGMAGRVHVSEVTLGFLKDEFEVEPAYGEKREEMLRQAGIKTYFIVKVLKPYQGDEKRGENAELEKSDTLSDLKDDDEDSVLSAESEKEASEDMLIHNMLVEELRNRDDDKELEETGWCYGFENEAEKIYKFRVYSTTHSSFILLPFFVFIPIVALALFITHWYLVFLSYLVHGGTIVMTAMIHMSGRSKPCVSMRSIMEAKQFDCREAMSLFNVAMFAASSLEHLVMCGQYSAGIITGRYATFDESCRHRDFYYHLSVCGLHCLILLASPSCRKRMLYLIVYATLHWIPFIPIEGEQIPLRNDWSPYKQLRKLNDTAMYDLYENKTHIYPAVEPVFYLETLHHFRHNIMLYLVAVCLLIFDRYLEAMQRARHLRGERMRKQAEQAGDLRRRNQALVYNVLPPHVARHFMGAQRNHRDLYSQSYAEVGVLFASMPNFTEFYSEETVNNQGLECLRFLNEVISDFDTLLTDARFRDIIKIKTISSTYMAASGLNPEQNVKDVDTTKQRWKHLMCLVEFALQLQRVLAAINEQSFNHFVLRMGVNHGPITAGVIGAKKPHYDIWGNTVNVASRMESTGKAGCIQVTEETCQILKDFGYYFEQRGLVAVKGKGQLMTYYLQGKKEGEPGMEGQQDAAAGSDSSRPATNGSVKVTIPEENEQGELPTDTPLLPPPAKNGSAKLGISEVTEPTEMTAAEPLLVKNI